MPVEAAVAGAPSLCATPLFVAPGAAQASTIRACTARACTVFLRRSQLSSVWRSSSVKVRERAWGPRGMDASMAPFGSHRINASPKPTVPTELSKGFQLGPLVVCVRRTIMYVPARHAPESRP